MHADPPILFQNAILTLYGHISHQINKTKKKVCSNRLIKKEMAGSVKFQGIQKLPSFLAPFFYLFFFLTFVFVVETTCIKFVLPLDQWYNCY